MRILTTIVALTFTFYLSAQELHLGGKALSPNHGKVYLQKYVNKSFITIDSAEVRDGHFDFRKRSDLKLPEIYGLSYLSSTANPFDSFIIFLDEGNIEVELDSTSQFRNTVVNGSKEHALFKELISKQENITSLIQKHPNSIAALYILYRYHSFRIKPAELRKVLSFLDPRFENTEYVKVLTELASTLERIGIGEKAPEFVAYDDKGNEIKSSSLVGNGYVLLDFWASWCAPCRAENPNLVKVYSKFKDKGLNIVSISLDNNVERWKTAYTKDHLEWLQLIDKKAWAGDGVVKFGIRLIPSNFLIDSDGKIIAHNLKGEDLELFLEELFNTTKP